MTNRVQWTVLFLTDVNKVLQKGLLRKEESLIKTHSENRMSPIAGDHQKSLSYKKFELCSPFALAMWPP